jgi:hypothetical protein
MNGSKRARRRAEPTETCGRCKWPYPEGALSPFVSSDGGRMTTVEMCAICALEAMNKLHGTNDETFHGEVAEWMRQNAVEWRAQHPELKP